MGSHRPSEMHPEVQCGPTACEVHIFGNKITLKLFDLRTLRFLRIRGYPDMIAS